MLWSIAQDEKSCMMFGMPRETIGIGAINEVLPLLGIAAALLRHNATARLKTD